MSSRLVGTVTMSARATLLLWAKPVSSDSRLFFLFFFLHFSFESGSYRDQTGVGGDGGVDFDATVNLNYAPRAGVAPNGPQRK